MIKRETSFDLQKKYLLLIPNSKSDDQSKDILVSTGGGEMVAQRQKLIFIKYLIYGNKDHPSEKK